jgi:hypothetical protein
MYTNYINFVREITNNKDLSYFKSNYHYRGILEHVSQEQGNEYLYFILNKTPISVEDIFAFCNLNDNVGGPLKEKFSVCNKDLYTSPTNLRYIYHAYHILNYFQTLENNINIVEVGGGYGGLCLALSYFSKYFPIKINDYNIIDLEEIIELQKLYLAHHTLNFSMNFHGSNTYGANVEKKENTFLISNYCFSEIEDIHQKKYIEILFPKIQHGFMTWNHIQLYNFGFQLRVEDEYPQTDMMQRMNKYVYF